MSAPTSNQFGRRWFAVGDRVKVLGEQWASGVLLSETDAAKAGVPEYSIKHQIKKYGFERSAEGALVARRRAWAKRQPGIVYRKKATAENLDSIIPEIKVTADTPRHGRFYAVDVRPGVRRYSMAW